jgi:hypothetical protein
MARATAMRDVSTMQEPTTDMFQLSDAWKGQSMCEKAENCVSLPCEDCTTSRWELNIWWS